jgi:quercetin dioxygenase-like cupin family protein
MEFSYPTDGKAKLIFAQGIFPIGAVLPMHTHPSPVVVHVLQGQLTSARPNGESITYNAGDSYIEAPNSPHKVTNTGKRPAIIYGVFTTVEGHGPLTIFK